MKQMGSSPLKNLVMHSADTMHRSAVVGRVGWPSGQRPARGPAQPLFALSKDPCSQFPDVCLESPGERRAQLQGGVGAAAGLPGTEGQQGQAGGCPSWRLEPGATTA